MAMDDADAFARLYEAESESVLVFLARRALDVEIAVELTAETFAVALGSWTALRNLTAEQKRAWLFTVARRRYSRYLRRAKVERRVLARVGVEVPWVGAEDVALIEQRAGLAALRGLVARELGRLSHEHQKALRLRVVEERSYEDVARELGVSEPAARARVSRGLRRLSAALEPHLNEIGEVVP
jgi:RNA polymerase sigma factor (sigma-70 family)